MPGPRAQAQSCVCVTVSERAASTAARGVTSRASPGWGLASLQQPVLHIPRSLIGRFPGHHPVLRGAVFHCGDDVGVSGKLRESNKKENLS